jgi:hypothetical protein
LEQTYGHDDAADANVWTQTLANACSSPEYGCET